MLDKGIERLALIKKPHHLIVCLGFRLFNEWEVYQLESAIMSH